MVETGFQLEVGGCVGQVLTSIAREPHTPRFIFNLSMALVHAWRGWTALPRERKTNSLRLGSFFPQKGFHDYSPIRPPAS